MSHLIKIYAVCKFSYFRLWYLKIISNCILAVYNTCAYYCVLVDKTQKSLVDRFGYASFKILNDIVLRGQAITTV